jgi:hypothetical protein
LKAIDLLVVPDQVVLCLDCHVISHGCHSDSLSKMNSRRKIGKTKAGYQQPYSTVSSKNGGSQPRLNS